MSQTNVVQFPRAEAKPERLPLAGDGTGCWRADLHGGALLPEQRVKELERDVERVTAAWHEQLATVNAQAQTIKLMSQQLEVIHNTATRWVRYPAVEPQEQAWAGVAASAEKGLKP